MISFADFFSSFFSSYPFPFTEAHKNDVSTHKMPWVSTVLVLRVGDGTPFLSFNIMRLTWYVQSANNNALFRFDEKNIVFIEQQLAMALCGNINDILDVNERATHLINKMIIKIGMETRRGHYWKKSTWEIVGR